MKQVHGTHTVGTVSRQVEGGESVEASLADCMEGPIQFGLIDGLNPIWGSGRRGKG